MEVSRRDFIRLSGLSLAAVVLREGISTVGSALAASPMPDSKHRWRFVIDTQKCIGCGRCVKACKLENNVPMERHCNRTWVERYVFGENEEVFVDSPDAGINGFTAEDVPARYKGLAVSKTFFVPKLCNHCSKPPCVTVCPVGATFATAEGVVLIDRKACIGCRYCIQACPYGARFFDPRLKIADKCTWCYHRITKGLPPACVQVCPVGARVFGDINDPSGPVTKLLRQEITGILKPEVGTDPKVLYIGLQQGVR